MILSAMQNARSLLILARKISESWVQAEASGPSEEHGHGCTAIAADYHIQCF